MGLLTRGEIDKAADLETIDVSCPEWGGDVRLRALDGVGRDLWTTSVSGEDRAANMANIRARLVALHIVDGDGKPMYPGAEGAAALGKKSGVVLDRLFEAANKLSKLTKADVDALEKNSGAAPSGDSSSGSAATSALSTPINSVLD